MHTVILGGKQWVIKEPVFRDLKVIIDCLNRLNNLASDTEILECIQSILISLLGACHVAKFQRYRWEAWKIPAPTPNELTALLSAIPKICGLQQTTATAYHSTATKNKSDDWDALYWRVIRVTGWTWETVDNTMTMSRLTAMQEHLNEQPLVDSLAAGYLGYEYQKPRTLEDDYNDWKATQDTYHGKH